MAEFLTLDPRDESAAGMGNIAPRPPTLDGRVIGLLSNNKPHSEGLLRMVADIIGQRYTIRGIVEYNKGRHQFPADSAALGDLARQCDVMVHATAE